MTSPTITRREMKTSALYYSDLLKETLLFTGEESHGGMQGYNFTRQGGGSLLFHASDIENLRLTEFREWTAEEILKREG